MAANEVVRARIDGRTKKAAASVLSEMGLTVSGAFRLMMVRIAHDKSLPFEPHVPHVPNRKTAKVMRAAMRGKGVKRVGTVEALFAEAHAGD